MIKHILHLYKMLHGQQKLWVNLCLFLTFIVSVLTVSYPVFFSLIIEKSLQQEWQAFAILVAAAGFTHMLSKVTSESRWFLLSRIEPELSGILKLRYLKEVLEKPPSFASEHGSGKIAENFKRFDAAIFFISRNLYFSLIPMAMQFCLIFALITYKFGLVYLLLSVLVIPAYFFVFIYGSTILDKMQKKLLVAEDMLSGLLSDIILSRIIIHLFNYEKAQIKKTKERFVNVEEQNAASLNRRGIYGLAHALTSSLAIIIMLVYSSVDLKNGALTVGGFVLINTYMLQIISPMDGLSKLFREFKSSILKLEHIENLLSETSKMRFGNKSLPKNIANNIKIEFKDVSFRYPGQSSFALENISFTIEGNQFVGIIGKSGSGKSTLTSLLLRFYDPTSGEIYINDVSIRELSRQAVYDIFAVAPQQNLVLRDTVKNNLLMGVRNYSDASLKDLCKKTMVDDFIKKLDKKYEYVLYNNDRNVSEGQAQRINLTRSLAANKPVLILDEVTSALDLNTEKKVLDNVQGILKKKLTLFISHRTANIQDADIVLVFEHGKLIETRSKKV